MVHFVDTPDELSRADSETTVVVPAGFLERAEEAYPSICPLRRAWSPRNDPADGSYHAHGRSHAGWVRERNEDAWGLEYLAGGGLLAAVADGMGGMQRGDRASQIAIQTLFQLLTDDPFGPLSTATSDLPWLLSHWFEQADRAVSEYAIRSDLKTGTTLCAMMVKDGVATVANLGDSRLYLVRDGRALPVTQDHTVAAWLLRKGLIDAEQARRHPSANALFRSLGRNLRQRADVTQIELRPGDRLLLCTDGLWGSMPDAQIASILCESPDPVLNCASLLTQTMLAGAQDNVTSVLVRVSCTPSAA